MLFFQVNIAAGALCEAGLDHQNLVVIVVAISSSSEGYSCMLLLRFDPGLGQGFLPKKHCCSVRMTLDS